MHAGRWIVIGIAVASVAAMYGGYVLRRAAAPPSVVLVTIDTLRADRVGAYGRSPSITPELDKLAARGVVFEHASTTAPITVPAHATLLTGLVPPKHGLRVNRPPVKLAPPADRRFFTLAEVLKEQHYATGAFVSASVLRAADTGFAAGFDTYDDDLPPAPPGSLHDAERTGRGEETVERALAWTRAATGPVFLWVHLFDPHAPYDAPTGWGAGPAHTADAQGYDGEVAYADHCVGLLLKGLAVAGYGDAVVLVVADHGEALGEHGEASHGYLVHEATVHVPMIFAAPGLAPARRSEPVSSTDVFPTLLSLAGQAIPPQANGMPLFAKSSAEIADRPIYIESLYPWHACRWAQEFALRRGDMKLISSGQRTMAFDLAKDPGEDHPAVPDAAQREELAQILRVAREPALGTMTPGDSAAPSGPYWSVGSGGATPVLSDEENAKLPSAYDRMDVLTKFDEACGLLVAGKAEAALAKFDEILKIDAGNVQATYWRGRALDALGRFAEAAASVRLAFDIGYRSPACVAQAIQYSLRAVTAPNVSKADADAEWTKAVEFLAKARGMGLRDDASVDMFEAGLYVTDGHVDRIKASEALDRAEKAPGIDAVRPRIDKARQYLESLSK